MRGNGHKMHLEKFSLDSRKNVLTEKILNHQNKLPRGNGGITTLETAQKAHGCGTW